ncbi:MAG: DUF3737 family protein [Bacilli bacterium]|nr:DUF3737 family protein [Bacilli bacterium]
MNINYKKIINNESFGEERALYNNDGLKLLNCKFEGIEDGESALKESQNLMVLDCDFKLRYPFWHVTNAIIEKTRLYETCRAPLWYSKNIEFLNCDMKGPKCLRECENITFKNSNIVSTEFGWKSNGIEISDSKIEGEYCFLDSNNIVINNVNLKGKYSFQYVKGLKIENSYIDTKDAFWHVKDAIIVNSTIKGEYLAWYSSNVTFINCVLEGTQPFCYCHNLKMVNCVMNNCDLAFERSTGLDIDVKSEVISVKNPYSGIVRIEKIGEIMIDDDNAKAKIESN